MRLVAAQKDAAICEGFGERLNRYGGAARERCSGPGGHVFLLLGNGPHVRFVIGLSSMESGRYFHQLLEVQNKPKKLEYLFLPSRKTHDACKRPMLDQDPAIPPSQRPATLLSAYGCMSAGFKVILRCRVKEKRLPSRE
ncbi:hypothetical protein ACLOJK_016739 [Asimina triloba]